MQKTLVLYPLFAQVLLTMMVWVWMYYTRIGEIRRQRIAPQKLADNSEAWLLLKSVSGPAENFVNLFELPVLFYAAVILMYVTDAVSTVALVLCWIFVVLRIAHSIIHTTYNKVIHRFAVYFMGALTLWGLWIYLFWQLMISTA